MLFMQIASSCSEPLWGFHRQSLHFELFYYLIKSIFIVGILLISAIEQVKVYLTDILGMSNVLSVGG